MELFDILGEVAAGHAFVDVFGIGFGVKRFDAGLDVVAGDAFAFLDGGEVDIGEGGLVGGDGCGRDGQAEVDLRLHDGDPQFAFEANFAGGGPDLTDRCGGVAASEDVWDHGDSVLSGWRCKACVVKGRWARCGRGRGDWRGH